MPRPSPKAPTSDEHERTAAEPPVAEHEDGDSDHDRQPDGPPVEQQHEQQQQDADPTDPTLLLATQPGRDREHEGVREEEGEGPVDHPDGGVGAELLAGTPRSIPAKTASQRRPTRTIIGMLMASQIRPIRSESPRREEVEK